MPLVHTENNLSASAPKIDGSFEPVRNSQQVMQPGPPRGIVVLRDAGLDRQLNCFHIGVDLGLCGFRASQRLRAVKRGKPTRAVADIALGGSLRI